MQSSVLDGGLDSASSAELCIVTITNASGESICTVLPPGSSTSDVKNVVETQWRVPPLEQQFVVDDVLVPETMRLSEGKHCWTMVRVSAVEVPRFVPNQNYELTLDSRRATLVGGNADETWHVVKIGELLVSGRQTTHILIDQAVCDQPPGVSVAFGLIVDNIGPGLHAEYVGNKWGAKYGQRLQVGNVVEICVDMDTKKLSFAVDGKDQGIRATFLPEEGVRMAVALSRIGDTVSICTVKKSTGPRFVPNLNYELALDRQRATLVAGSQNGAWHVIEIGELLVEGRHAARIHIDHAICDQPPGVSVAFGLTVESDRVSCPKLYGEYVGNTWGSKYGQRLQVGNLVEICVDMDTKKLSFAVDGQDQGVRATFLPEEGVRMAVALSRIGDTVSVWD